MHPLHNEQIPLIVAWTRHFPLPLSERLKRLLNREHICIFVNRTEANVYNKEPSAFIIHGPNMDIADLQQIPLIVAWTSYFPRPISERLKPLLDCEHICIFVNRTEATAYNKEPSAYIIHGPNMDIADLPVRGPDTLVIMLNMESPFNAGSGIHMVPPNYFNAVITYRKDARYHHPYAAFLKLNESNTFEEVITAEQVKEAVKLKKRGSLILVSDCDTWSSREEIIHVLARYTDVSVRGGCVSKWKKRFGKTIAWRAPPSYISDDELIVTHRFYISFENSICDEYITEKYFYRLSQLLVPVVLRRKIMEDMQLPRDSFIALDDFTSIEQLAKHLNRLRKHDHLYMRYFKWTEFLAKPLMYRSEALCNLCNDIHNGSQFVMRNIVDYYIDTSRCIS